MKLLKLCYSFMKTFLKRDQQSVETLKWFITIGSSIGT